MQILDAALVANEAIDSWKRRSNVGLVCKLDIEKAYDNVNWNFLLSVLEKMGFGPKWRQWILYCISTARMVVLVNGIPINFFSTHRGLRQGDPLSPYLFVLNMKAFNRLIGKAEEGGFIRGVKIEGGMEDVDRAAALFGCKAEVCKDKKHGGLGLRHLEGLNQDLLGKWLWRFFLERENLWRKVILGKFGEVEGGWTAREVRDSYGLSLWKTLEKAGKSSLIEPAS
ncbi:hypothetical protein CK203_061775 [Vitis vinifera]|uniref:Reverse transcriptase domain-containing protein n=1 Tax=Vitis vinifera TaxID=29760 RepID=A0A438GB39_VITVI|nr:hypothetical protein CK203_061775 [Vitis vinifera]